MNYHRAEEIINSEDTIEVFYNNQPVWINNLDPNKKLAHVIMDEKTIEIPVAELVEGERLE